MVKGLAKQGNCLRHDPKVKCVDVSLFASKSGYSPMTARILSKRGDFVEDFRPGRLRAASVVDPVVIG